MRSLPGRRPSGTAPRSGAALAILPFVLAASLAGCGSATSPSTAAPAEAPGAAATPVAEGTAKPATPGTPDPAEPSTAAVSGTCDLPSLDLRAAQVLLVGIPGTTVEEGGDEVAAAGVGGILLFGPNLVDADQVTALTAGLQAAADVPLAIATDEEPGRIGRLAAAGIIPSSPSARDLGKRSASVIRATALKIGRAMAKLGLTVDLAPVLDVTGAAAGGVIGDRSFGSDPAAVSRDGVAFADGLAAAGIAAVGKHFPGHGETTVDSHTSLPVVPASLATLRKRALPPFAAAIDAGIPAIMLGHLLVDALDASRAASVSSKVVQVLRRDLGFTGLIMTDDMYMGGITERWDVPDAVVLALRAGADMAILSVPYRVDEVKKAIVDAVGAGRLEESRLDEAFLRVERFKGVDRWAPCEAAP
jgi:beta-N-acetylhexosaminidase